MSFVEKGLRFRGSDVRVTRTCNLEELTITETWKDLINNKIAKESFSTLL
jgi:hypothetical protein